jgi:hypothetical protein
MYSCERECLHSKLRANHPALPQGLQKARQILRWPISLVCGAVLQKLGLKKPPDKRKRALHIQPQDANRKVAMQKQQKQNPKTRTADFLCSVPYIIFVAFFFFCLCVPMREDVQ